MENGFRIYIWFVQNHLGVNEYWLHRSPFIYRLKKVNKDYSVYYSGLMIGLKNQIWVYSLTLVPLFGWTIVSSFHYYSGLSQTLLCMCFLICFLLGVLECSLLNSFFIFIRVFLRFICFPSFAFLIRPGSSYESTKLE